MPVAERVDGALRGPIITLPTLPVLPTTPNKDAVRNYIWNWMNNPIGTGLTNSNNLANQGVMSDTKTLKCFLKIFDYSNPSEELMNSDQSMDVLYPGSLIQGKKI